MAVLHPPQAMDYQFNHYAPPSFGGHPLGFFAPFQASPYFQLPPPPAPRFPPSKVHKPRRRKPPVAGPGAGAKQWNRRQQGARSLYRRYSHPTRPHRGFSVRPSLTQGAYTTPRTVPPAPDNASYGFLAPASCLASPTQEDARVHTATPNPFQPGTAWRQGFSGVDREAAELGAAAGIDLYGTNQPLLSCAEDGTWSDDESVSDEGAQGRSLDMAELESRNMALEDAKLRLEEQVYLLSKQVADLQRRLAKHEEQEDCLAHASSSDEAVAPTSHSPVPAATSSPVPAATSSPVPADAVHAEGGAH
ncbi:hypothetical protein V8C86DRAFT_2462739 [Haematococcus lacustris]